MKNTGTKSPVKLFVITGTVAALLIAVLTHGPAVAVIKSSARTVLMNSRAERHASPDGAEGWGRGVDQGQVQEVQFVDAWGRRWSETELLTCSPIRGGLQSVEAKLLERALANMQPAAQ